jgi:hypothetical protein
MGLTQKNCQLGSGLFKETMRRSPSCWLLRNLGRRMKESSLLFFSFGESQKTREWIHYADPSFLVR